MDTPVTFNSSGNRIAAIITQLEKPNGKGIVLLHCFTCTKHHKIMRTLATDLASRGFSVLRFDFSGNGESQGNIEEATYTRMLGEVRDAVSLLNSHGVKKVGVAGHSMGAMLAILSAQADPRISAVAFIAGSSQASRVREVFPKEAIEKAERDGIAESEAYGKKITLRKEFLLDVEKYNVGHAAATLNRPILIIHGKDDETIPFYHARQLFGWCSGPKTLELMENTDHLFKKEGS
ncbi:MAG: alpha/beta hydrolase, partial [candidate division Zixibacteria bacterium]|nr:alpha/beta hydrolase [candidate division Zixibacteria bacterium]